MTDYTAPVRDMRFVLEELCDLDGLARLPAFPDAARDTVAQILEEAGRFAAGAVAPLNRSGDIEGARLVDGVVRTPEGYAEAYRAFVEGGWNGMPFPAEIGGMGLPWAVATAMQEMIMAANLAWSTCPLLTFGAVEALMAHGSDALKETYLPKLVTGEWSGTMNLTEPQAGTDLALLRTRAVPEGDRYRITGTKIFITYGEHELADNIIHLVLARLPDAPPGVRGISLFLVPKYLVNPDGSRGERNDLRAVSLEHKMGLRGSPTCVMSYGDNGGAIGWLIGEEHQGLRCMFTMMNNARLNVGLQGVAIGDRAYQQALAYARQRVQSVPVSGGDKSVTIINHPDVRRMLMTMRAQTEASRALAYYANACLDRAHHDEDEGERRRWQVRTDLLTPIVKAWSTDLGVDSASIGIQVHGGMGFIEETGAAQHLRDIRIAPIYEGTNGIQANDLLGRKLLRDGGAGMIALVSEIAVTARNLRREAKGDGDLVSIAESLDRGRVDLERATAWLLDNSANDIDQKYAGAVPYLALAGTVAGGWQMARAALAARKRLDGGDGDRAFLTAKLATARFFADHILPRTAAYLPSITEGAASVLALAPEAY